MNHWSRPSSSHPQILGLGLGSTSISLAINQRLGMSMGILVTLDQVTTSTSFHPSQDYMHIQDKPILYLSLDVDLPKRFGFRVLKDRSHLASQKPDITIPFF
jgi:hypothetical protein